MFCSFPCSVIHLHLAPITFLLTEIFINMKYLCLAWDIGRSPNRFINWDSWQFVRFNFFNLHPLSPPSGFRQVYLTGLSLRTKWATKKWRIRVQLQKSWWSGEAAPWVPQQRCTSSALGTLPQISQCLMYIPFLRLNRQDTILTKLWVSGYAMGQICNFRSRLLTCGKTIHYSSPFFIMSAWWVKKLLLLEMR